MHSTSYIIKFTLIMTVIVAFVLALMVSGLKGIHSENEAVYNKKGILSAVSGQLGKDVLTLSNQEVQDIFSKQIEQKVINMKGEELTPDQIKAATGGTATMADQIDLGKEAKKPEADRLLPIFTFKGTDNKTYNILYVRGKGLWDEIWGYIAFEDDWNTISGEAFDHKGETPGLGAEIKDNKSWYSMFTGKKIYNTKGEFTSVSVVKGGVKDPTNQVDAISGATITGNGVHEMLRRGLKYYEPYILKNKKPTTQN
ncbi:MAG: NADH:ubiquinone reductase (Na(+)-transporting) subunit C [Saprospiraceae bacterium]|nr:NADH:ubiquinone reductase (Na(+)-transporting) subunit C [Saprospiraceae bacterium]